MTENIRCPKCNSDITYPQDDMMVCTQCFNEWKPGGQQTEVAEQIDKVLDANGNELENGDSVILVKDLPVKGYSKALKAGTKVKNIRLTDGDHNIDCRIDGFGFMALKSKFVKKA
jgi:protein PhnA